MTKYSAILEYLQTLYGDDASGNLVHFDIETRRQTAFPYAQREMAAKFLANLPTGKHGHMAFALHAGMTRTGETALVLPGLALDVDFNTGVHAAQNLPDDSDHALRLIEEAGLPSASLVVHSGGGCYPIWPFSEPLVMGTAEARSAATDLWRGFETAARLAWQAHGLKLDTVSDLARVLRVPGTLNWKTDPPRPVALSHQSGRRFTAENCCNTCLPRNRRTSAGHLQICCVEPSRLSSKRQGTTATVWQCRVSGRWWRVAPSSLIATATLSAFRNPSGSTPPTSSPMLSGVTSSST